MYIHGQVECIFPPKNNPFEHVGRVGLVDAPDHL